LREVEEKKKTFSTLSLPLITIHIDTSPLYLYWKNKHKLEKEAKTKKKREKGEEILKFFVKVRHSQFFLSAFDLVFFNFHSFFFNHKKYFFPFLYCLPGRSRRMISNLDFCFF